MRAGASCTRDDPTALQRGRTTHPAIEKSLLVFASVFVLFFHLFVIAYEEPTLRQKFGADYERYLASVPRRLPMP
jgi:hypothetical protein